MIDWTKPIERIYEDGYQLFRNVPPKPREFWLWFDRRIRDAGVCSGPGEVAEKNLYQLDYEVVHVVEVLP